MVDASVYVVIILAGVIFFFLARLRMTQETVHEELKQQGKPVTEHPFPSGNMGADTETVGKKLGKVVEDVKEAVAEVTTTTAQDRPSTPVTRSRSRKAD